MGAIEEWKRIPTPAIDVVIEALETERQKLANNAGPIWEPRTATENLEKTFAVAIRVLEESR